MKKITSILLTLAMILSIVPTFVYADNNSGFTDVNGNEYYAEAAKALNELKMLEGYPDGTFGAENSITRAEMAAIVCRTIAKEKEAEKATGKTNFDDVQSNHWASGYINIAAEEGIINGDGDGKFRPEDDVKYEEAVKMVVCSLGFADDVKVNPNDWSAEYLKIANEKGITKNLKGSKGNAATRGDIAVMSYNGLITDLVAPTASKAAGDYKGTQKIELSTTTKDADIYYTTDGTTPTVKSTKYTKAISISKTSTLKAIAVLSGVLVSDVMSVDYTIKKSSGGGGGGSSSTTKYTVSFDLNYEGATGAPENQSVKSGLYANMPTNPEREGFAFVGWYTDNTYSELFNFITPITKAYTLVARWVDITDTTDTDGDGLTDPIEEYYGTDKTKTDTDDDGLTDFFEIKLSNTNPLDVDSDKNGVKDADEDFDEDKLTNIQEQTNNSNPYSDDTDMDGLTDYDEINTYNTKPDTEDTDEDGIADGDEIELGLDPLIQKTDGITLDSERIFTQDLNSSNISEELMSDENLVKPSLNYVGTGNLNGDSSITISSAIELENNKSIVGEPIDLDASVDLEKNTTTLSFDINNAISLFASDDNDSVNVSPYIICEYSDDEILPLETQRSGEKVSAEINHSGTYFVLDIENFLMNLGIDPMSYFKDNEETISLMNLDENAESTIPHLTYEERKKAGNNINHNITKENNINNIQMHSARSDESVISLMSSNDGKGQADVVFLIDATGSMDSAISNVALNINTFAQQLVGKYNINANFSVIEFQDITFDGLESTVQHKNASSPWFNAGSVNAFKNKVNSITAKDGGDWEETPIDAIELGRKLVETSKARKFFVLITDAPYKNDNRYGIASMDEMIQKLKTDGINMSVITDPEIKDQYQSVYTQTGGLFGNIYSDFSTVLENIANVINDDVNDGYWILLKGNYEAVKLLEKPTTGSSVDTDNDGIPDCKELTSTTGEVSYLQAYIEPFLKSRGKTWTEYVANGGQQFVYVYNYNSNPVVADTDGDGIPDNTDPKPREYHTSDRHLALMAHLSYTTKDIPNAINKEKDFLGYASLNELTGWHLVDYVDKNTNVKNEKFAANTYKNENTIVIAFRGTDEGLINENANVIIPFMAHSQSSDAEKYAIKICKRYPKAKIYITGHSLGGYLANYAAGVLGRTSYNSRFVRCADFNGLGMDLTGLLSIKDSLKKNSLKLVDYRIKKDVVSLIGNHYGTKYEYSEIAPKVDDKYSNIAERIFAMPHHMANFHIQSDLSNRYGYQNGGGFGGGGGAF